MKASLELFILALILLTSSVFHEMAHAEDDLSHKHYEFSDKNELIAPKSDVYRDWIFVGTPLTPNDMNNGKANFPEFHNVYIDPISWRHFQKTGKFRDGAIMIKEMVSVGSKLAASGAGYFMGDYIGLEVSIKDKSKFPNEPGNWAYFSFTKKDHTLPVNQTTKAFPAASCNSCHAGIAKTDFVFTQYYPVLGDVLDKMKK